MVNTFLITPGELSGIGLEVTLKTLDKINSKDSYIFYTKENYLKEHLEFFDIKLKPQKIKTPSTDLPQGVYYIDSLLEPVEWFKEACVFCNEHPFNSALITGPLTKKSFNDPKILGHTEYLRSKFPNCDVFMTFFGEHYNCLLLNDHIPLTKVSDDVSLEKINKAYKAITKVFKTTNLGLLGLNPHAGENGLIGTEEISIHQKACEENKHLKGPLSPDGFFNPEEYKKYDFLIANYHDQGLIPFKLINGFKASQASLGLSFIRTSVDHGTSENLFMKNMANPSSMEHAIKLANQLLNFKNNI